MEGLLIGQMAAINHVTEQTLRHYDKIGLLKPYYIDESNNYRYYNIKQCARLDMIQNMKSLGMPLEQIKDLYITKKAVERAIINFQRYDLSPPDGTIVAEYIPKRKIYSYYTDINFYNYNLETYEYILRELKQHSILKELPMVYFCNVGTILRKDKLKQQEFISNEMFIFIDDDFADVKGIETLKASTYLCIYCDSFHKEKEYANRLLAEIRRNGYEITGDYICEVIADMPIFTNNERGMFIKIQVPIKF